MPRGWKMSHRGVGTPEHPVRMGRKLVGKTPRVSFQAQRRAETGAWEGDGGGGERERETPVYRAAALCRQTFRCMAWGGYQGRETQEECSGPRGAAGDAAGLPGWLGGHARRSGASPAGSPRTLLQPLLRSEAWAAEPAFCGALLPPAGRRSQALLAGAAWPGPSGLGFGRGRGVVGEGELSSEPLLGA